MESTIMNHDFKSPVKKLTVFFKLSRDKWKEKCKNAMQEIRGYKKRIEFLEISKAQLKEKNKALKEKLNSIKKDLEDSKKKSNNN